MVCYIVKDGSDQENNIKITSVIVGNTATEVNLQGNIDKFTLERESIQESKNYINLTKI